MLLKIWGKCSPTQQNETHPLLFHILDTGMVVLELWKHCLQGSLKRLLVGALEMDEEAGVKFLALAAGLHDIGKCCPPFQGKNEKMKQLQVQGGLGYPGFIRNAYHGSVTARVLPDLLRRYFNFTGSEKEWMVPLAFTVGGHHGQFPTPLEAEINDLSLGGSPWSDIRTRIFTTYANFLDAQTLSFSETEPPPAFFVIMAGLTSVADWIASNQDHFPMAGLDVDPVDYLAISEERAGKALRTLGWVNWKPPEKALGFTQLFPEIPVPRPLQRHTSELVWPTKQPRLLVIEAPMGEGKTEAAMQQIEAWSADLAQQGCYFALPTQATSNQMFSRVRDFLARRYPHDRVHLQLLHGRAAFSEAFQELRLNALYDFESGEGDLARVVAESWFTPKKRGLLAPFGVGTVDQVLLAALKTRHVFVRLFALAGKTIVIDEVHAYDLYMSNILERLLEWFNATNTSVILLSATLPAVKRQALLHAYAGRDIAEPSHPGYPRMTWVEGERDGGIGFEAYQQKCFYLKWIKDDSGLLDHHLAQALSKGGAAAVVCNTVHRAQQTFMALKKGEIGRRAELMLFHARFPLEERLVLEERVLALFGKKSERSPKRPLVLVATQLIEQSLDIDFDLMVTDLAPVDLMMQRAGRVHRHQRSRPEVLKKPTIWVRTPDMDETGLPQVEVIGPVYDRDVMLKSYLALRRGTVILPNDMDEIIEMVYGPEDSDMPEYYRKALHKAEQEARVRKEDDTYQARLREIPPPVDTTGSLVSWLAQFNGGLEEDDPRTHRSLQAQTRLGPPSVQIVCLHKINGVIQANLTLAGELDLGSNPDQTTTADLIMREISLSHRGLVNEILAIETPAGWRKNPMLRYHKPLVFENGITRAGDYTLELSPGLGLVINKIT